MKTLPAGLQAHLDSGSTTMTYCWRVTRLDGLVQGFTEHDKDLTFDGTVFEAASGFTSTTVSSELGLSVDNLNVDGALSSDTLNEEDLATGLYDDASVELFWVNFEDTSQRITQMKGSIGEVERGEFAFSAETRSLTHRMQQKTGRSFQRYCDLDLGEARCGVNLLDPAFSSSGVVTSSTFNRLIISSGVSNNTDNFYGLGKMIFTSGQNNGLSFAVKKQEVNGTDCLIHLWVETPFPIANTDTFTIFSGCEKIKSACIIKFNNIANFRGFPYIPGSDFVTKYAKKGDSEQNGTTLFPNQ